MKFEYNGHLEEMERILLVADEIVGEFSEIPMDKAMKIAALEDVITTECDSIMYFKRLYNILFVMQDKKNVFDKVLSEIKKVYNKFDGEKDMVIVNPKNLMQSADLTYARSRFLIEERFFSEAELAWVIFRNAHQFQSKFKVTKKDLLDRYRYDEYKKRKQLTNK